MDALLLSVSVPASLSSYLYDSVVEAVHEAAMSIRKTFGIRVKVEVREEADAAPQFHTFHTFHQLALGDDVPIKVEVSYRDEESSDFLAEVTYHVKQLTNNAVGPVAVGMSGVGVADVA